MLSEQRLERRILCRVQVWITPPDLMLQFGMVEKLALAVRLECLHVTFARVAHT